MPKVPSGSKKPEPPLATPVKRIDPDEEIRKFLSTLLAKPEAERGNFLKSEMQTRYSNALKCSEKVSGNERVSQALKGMMKAHESLDGLKDMKILEGRKIKITDQQDRPFNDPHDMIIRMTVEIRQQAGKLCDGIFAKK